MLGGSCDKSMLGADTLDRGLAVEGQRSVHVVCADGVRPTGPVSVGGGGAPGSRTRLCAANGRLYGGGFL